MILDGHNDLLLRVWRGEEPRHLELLRAREQGFAGGFFALFVPGEPFEQRVRHDVARRVALELYAELERLDVVIARTVDDFASGRVTAIVHLEGAEPLAPDLSDLDEWYERGLRSVGLVWSRPNAFAEGVPFAFPASPDTGPGLTAAGRRLVRGCNERGILLDCSHLNRRGFFDVAALSDAPLVATHSNAHALCPASRNLDDEQLDAVARAGGVVGVTFAVTLLREDGSLDRATPLEDVCRHVDHLVERMGIDHVAFGSDYEGADVPDELSGGDFRPLLAALRARGYEDAALAKLTHENWLRVLRATWHVS